MAAVPVSILLVTALLLLGGQAAYLDYPYDSMPDDTQAKSQLFDTTNTQELQHQLDDLDQTEQQFTDNQISDAVFQKSGTLDEADDIAKTEAQTCKEKFTSQLKILMQYKKTCKSAGFRDCCQLKSLMTSSSSGTYTFERFCDAPCEPFSSAGTEYTLEGYCDLETDQGGWLVIQKRILKGTLKFRRTWEEYETGFGDLNSEFWYGLRNLHCITSRDDVELRIDMLSTSNKRYTTTYQTFKVDGAGDKFKLTIGGGRGHDPNVLLNSNGQYFSAYDQDNDQVRNKNCANAFGGGWWYKHCQINLNDGRSAPYWGTLRLGAVEMMIRPKKCDL